MSCWRPPPPWPRAPTRLQAGETATRSWRTSPSSTPSPSPPPPAFAAGANTTYDNRTALDTWTLARVITRAGGNTGLRQRIRRQGEALCALGGLSDAELDTLVPTLLLSNGDVLVDQPLPLRDLITGLAEAELPGHTKQLLALRLG